MSARLFADVATEMTRLHLLKVFSREHEVPMEISLFHRLFELIPSVNEALADMRGNKNQNCLALAALTLFEQYKKVILTVPSGKGKSRIVFVFLALYFLHKVTVRMSSGSKVHLYFSHNGMMQADTVALDALSKNLRFSFEKSVVKEYGTTIKTLANHVYIVDEADYALIDLNYTFTGPGYILCLTATAAKSTEALENSVYDS